MIRITALWLFIVAVGALSLQNWYRGVLGLVALIAVVEHPDFPKSLAGIQGLNPWNILLVITMLSWIINRRKEGYSWDMPRGIRFLLMAYVFLIIVAFTRAASDLGSVIEYAQLLGTDDIPTFAGLFSEHIINGLKWLIPALMLYDGCRDEARLRETVLVIIGVYFLLAVQIIRWMPLSALIGGEDLGERALKILSNEVGFHRVNLSMMMSGSAWAAVFAVTIFQNRSIKLGLYVAAGIISFAMALTGGRTGYVTWAVMAMLYAWTRSRKMFFLLPVLVVIAVPVIPGLSDRLTSGFGGKNVDTNVAIHSDENVTETSGVDLYTVTSGRTFAWPFVIEKIAEKPWLGYGKLAMQRSGVSSFLLMEYGEQFPHPHNMYLEWIFDNGLIGALPVFIFFAMVLVYGFRLLGGNSIESGLGGMTIALVGAILIAGFGSQTFYPREGALCMWVAILLTVRWHQLRTPVPLVVLPAWRQQAL
jgi:O-antigen ligase